MIDFNKKKGFICDMDGVIYYGNRVLPGVKEFIEWLKDPYNVQLVNEYRKDMYNDLLQAQGEDKQAASLSAILAADAIASTIFFHDGNELNVEDVVSIMTKKKDIDANIRA